MCNDWTVLHWSRLLTVFMLDCSNRYSNLNFQIFWHFQFVPISLMRNIVVCVCVRERKRERERETEGERGKERVTAIERQRGRKRGREMDTEEKGGKTLTTE